MKIRFFLLILVFFLQLFLSGCWDYEEYESMVQVTAIGFDFNKETNEATFSVQFIPTAKGGKSSGTEESKPSSNQVGIVHSATDKTLFGALAKVQQVVFKKLFFGYLKVMIIGNDCAKYKMLDIMELVDRTPVLRTSAYIAIVSGKAEDTISTIDSSNTISSSQQIFNLIDLSKNTGASYPVTIQDFSAMLYIGGLEAIAPHIFTSVYKENNVESTGGSHNNIRLDEQRNGDQVLAGTAAFKGGELVGWLDDKESLGYGWITGKNILAYKTSDISGEDDTEDILYYRVSKSKSKIQVQIEDDKPIINVDVNVIADLRKYYGNSGSEFLSPDEVNTVEKKLSDSIRSDINAALIKCQKEFNSDIFGFGFALFRENPKLWRTEYEQKWNDIFPNIPVNINVKSKVINTGTNIRHLDVK